MEKIQTGFRSVVRLLIFFIYICCFLAFSSLIHFLTRDPTKRRRRFAENGVRWTRIICKTFRIRVIVKGDARPDQVGLVVGNHLGFIDIIAAASVRANLFVTSQEMRNTPFLGLLTEMGGCLYVDRQNRKGIVKELGEIIESLKIGFRVILYPEAMSTNGEGILPFKRTLLTAAAHANVPLLPYVFNFREINGEPGFPMKYRDSVCWYGETPFHVAIWRAFSLKSLVCEIEFLSPVYTRTDQDRAAVADAVRDMILEKYTPVAPL